MDPVLYNAMALAEEIRAQHNGVAGVYLYLGHDGDNVCTLKDSSSKEVGKGCSGRNLFEAVTRAQNDLRVRRYLSKLNMEDVARLAGKQFGISDNDPVVFNTACFHTVLEGEGGFKIGSQDVVDLLSEHPQIVRLCGGCHWLLLPYGHRRFS